MFDYNLALATGIDIPIPEFQIVVHQPTIAEIAMIGERDFFTGIQLLCINKSMYIDDQALLAQTTNFQIFMTMMHEKQVADKRLAVEQVLALLFPTAKLVFLPGSIILNCRDVNSTIDESNFEILQQLLRDMFCLSKTDQDNFNPADQRAKEIAEKLMKARQRVAQQKAKEQSSGSMFGQYLSILTIGTGSMTLRDCIQLTMYQLYDLVERYSLYINWDIDIRSRMAGAKADKPIDNWMKNIHENK